MRAHYIQHVPFEGLGSIKGWLESAGFEITLTQIFRTFSLPDISEVDMLIVLGGPMSVNDEDRYPWLVSEKVFIRNFIESGKPVLGICLGAQLIASALDGKVYPNSAKEIGWFPILAVPSNKESTFHFPKTTEVFHWHGETFTLPSNAILLAESKACKNQAFQIKRSVIGLQFHLETTMESAEAIVENCRDELALDTFVQSEEAILTAPPERYESINKLMEDVLEYLYRNGRE